VSFERLRATSGRVGRGRGALRSGPWPTALLLALIFLAGMMVDGFFTSLPYDITEAEFTAQKQALAKASG
jgi:hypothetical protein